MRRLLLAAVIVLVAVFTCAAHDASVPIPRQISTRVAVAAIEAYRAHGSRPMSHFVRCRFQPHCSAYGLAAVRKYGAFRGGAKALWRVARCNPLTPVGTVDEP